MFLESYLLTIVIFLPFMGALLLFLLPHSIRRHAQWIALGIAVFEFGLSILIFDFFDPSTHLLQLVQKTPWIPSLGVSYFIGIDGLSLWLVLLTTFLTPIVILASEIKDRGYLASFLILETAMVGTFLALDLLLFYLFWEMMLIPMYFIIGMWGGARRIYATLKFFIYTLAGGVFMLLGIIFLIYLHHEQFGFFSGSLLDIYAVQIPFDYSHFLNPQNLLFLAFALAFLIKVPMFPFHTWLPDAHVEAPTGGSVILAGVLLKMGAYGFLRFAIPLFPEATTFFTPALIALSLIGVIYGAFLALAQNDLKKLVAYSSISHMGLVMLGLFVSNGFGLTGSVFQMLAHGVSTGALFLLVGIIYERRHTREISHFGGLTKVMPMYAVFFMIVTLSSLALPTTNGFIGEFLVLLGAFEARPLYAVLGGATTIFSATYLLRMYQKVMFGPLKYEENRELRDLSPKEMASLIPIIIMVFWMGLYPKTFLSKMEKSIDHLVSQKHSYELEIYERK